MLYRNDTMNNMKTNFGQLIGASVCAAVVGLATQASAISYNLYSKDATKNDGNLKSDFYQATPSAKEIKEEGAAASLYSTKIGGTDKSGFWVEIDFGANPKPVLTSAFLKAGDFHILWDSADLASFNTGAYTSITLWNSGVENSIMNKNKNAYLGTSHAGLFGAVGVPPKDPPIGGAPVPDAGSTLMLLGAGLTGIGLLRRRITG